MEGNKTNIGKVLTDPLSYETLTLCRKCIVVAWLFFSAMGLCTNTINMQTFIRIKIDDSVTLSFFAMAVSDFGVCSLGFAEGIITVCNQWKEELNFQFEIAPIVFHYMIGSGRKICTFMTALITTYVALQRCLCVLIPFRVKGMFTNFKTFCFLACSASFFVISFGLFLSRHKIVDVPSPLFFNVTQKTIYVRPGSEPYLFLIYGFTGVVLNVGCQCVVVACLIVMFVTLKRSIRFRRELTSSVGPNSKDANLTTDETAAKPDSSMSAAPGQGKEIQALKQVALVSFIFVCANSIFCVIGLASTLVPEFQMFKAYNNLFRLAVVILITTEQMNASVNFFVYYNFNAKFRKACILTRSGGNPK